MAQGAVAQLLFGDRDDAELPSLPELAAAAAALASGQRHKVLLPLSGAPAELALSRRGSKVLVTHYTTASPPEVSMLNREVSLASLVDVCGYATLELARHESDATARDIARRVAERALATTIAPQNPDACRLVRIASENPERQAAVAFGFEAHVVPDTTAPSKRAARADVHALLFEGTLWGFVRGRRVLLARGPIMLAVQRMLTAIRAVLDAREAGRPANVRLRSGGFHVGIRTESSGTVSLSLGAEGSGAATAASLAPAEAFEPVLRLATELARALIQTDRAQAKNLLVRAMRDEVRALRRALRAPRERDSFVNDDPDRLRASAPPEPTSTAPVPVRAPSSSLRFGERWRIAVDGLDATATFLCGDRLVLATAKHTVAVDRDEGTVLWARPGEGRTCLMAGAVLVRASNDGEVELCSVDDGEPFAETRIAPRGGAPLRGTVVGGAGLPPSLVLTEGADRLVAIDLRTGELRWRFALRSGGPLRLAKAGRVLVVASEGALHALDVATGEDVWRVSAKTRFPLAPTIVRDGLIAVSAGGDDGAGAVYGIDLFSGHIRFRRPLERAATAAPVAAGALACIACGGPDGGRLVALDATRGDLRFEVSDPGIGRGGAAMALDGQLVTNAPGGWLAALSLEDGRSLWSQSLADPTADDVPRRLEPILRGGALFVPAASVHVVRPSDGARLGASLPCDLVPDVIRVDERGWVYVAEESGHIAAYAPVAHLTLIRGGA